MFTRLLAACVGIFFAASAMAADPVDPANAIVIETKSGDVVIQLRPDLAPKHVERIKTLVADGAYDNVAFHRVIPGFMAQTGDVQFGDMEDGFNINRAGTGGSEYGNLPAEFTSTPFERGVVGMARSSNPNSANSQFFIMFDPAPHLNGQYTVLGEVVSGMPNIDNVTPGDQGGGRVSNPDRMISVRMYQ